MGRFPITITDLSNQINILSRSIDEAEEYTIGEGYFTLFRGSGLEFKGHREYSPGDNSRDIDWKASLRSDKILIKEYFQEKGMDVIFIYDTSQSMLFGSREKIKAHYGAEFILTLAGVASGLNYNVGLVCFSDKINQIFSPASGKNQLSMFLGVLGEHSTYGGGFDLTRALEFIDATYSPGSVIFIVSDFLGGKIPIEQFRNKFRRLTRRFDIISVILRDPRDEYMPSENINVVVSSPYENKSVFFNAKKIKKRYEAYAKKQKEDLKKFLNGVDSEYLELYTDKAFIYPTVRFFKKRDIIISKGLKGGNLR